MEEIYYYYFEIAYFASGLIMLALAFMALARRSTLSLPFMCVMLVHALLALSKGNDLINTSPDRFWELAKVMAIGIAGIGPAWFSFALAYAGFRRFLKLRLLLLLCLAPAVFLVLCWTNDFHHLVVKDVHFFHVGRYLLHEQEYGPAFLLIMAYNYLLFLGAVILFLFRTFSGSRPLRFRSLLLTIAILIPLLPNFLLLTGIWRVRGIDISPIFYSVSGVILFYGIVRFNILDAVPVARDYLVRNMANPMVVFAGNFQKLDSNRAYERLLEDSDNVLIEVQLKEILSADWEEKENGTLREAGVFELSSGSGVKSNYYSVQATRLFIRRDRVAYLVILQDITTLKDYENELSVKADQLTDKNMALEEALVELEELRKLALDASPSTGLPGNNSINNAIERAIRAEGHLCVIYSDLDNFKAFNDKYGFGQGDRVIRYNAEVLVRCAQEVCGPGAFIGHVGGDDFVMLVPSECARKLGDEIIKRFDRGIREYYDKKDRDAGGIKSKNRKGQDEWFPVISISLAGVDLKDRPFSHYLQVTNICAEVKKRSKAVPGSSFFMDRRRLNSPAGSA